MYNITIQYLYVLRSDHSNHTIVTSKHSLPNCLLNHTLVFYSNHLISNFITKAQSSSSFSPQWPRDTQLLILSAGYTLQMPLVETGQSVQPCDQQVVAVSCAVAALSTRKGWPKESPSWTRQGILGSPRLNSAQPRVHLCASVFEKQWGGNRVQDVRTKNKKWGVNQKTVQAIQQMEEGRLARG